MSEEKKTQTPLDLAAIREAGGRWGVNKGKLNKLLFYRGLLLEYVYSKIEINDLHGAIDALMDMREIDAQINLLNSLEKKK